MDNNQRNLLVGAGVGALLAYAIAPRRKTFDFEGKAVLIAGGSRGLGLALAGELLEQGARVAICARDENTLAEARRQLGRPNVMTIACDIVDPNAVASMIGEVSRRFGRIDVLINSAGTIDVGPMENLSLADYHKAMDINFWGPLHTMLAVFPMMQRNGGGRIVNIASIGGLVAVPHLAPYSASEFALVGASKALRAEMARHNIVVTTIAPGLMRTGSPRNADFKGQHQAEYAWFSIADSNPLLSMDARRAARQILDACRRGDAEVVLTTQAKLAARFDSLFPELSADLMEVVAGMLPGPVPGGERSQKGRDSESRITRSPLTGLSRKAERELNQRA